MVGSTWPRPAAGRCSRPPRRAFHLDLHETVLAEEEIDLVLERGALTHATAIPHN